MRRVGRNAFALHANTFPCARIECRVAAAAHYTSTNWASAAKMFWHHICRSGHVPAFGQRPGPDITRTTPGPNKP